jgi:hypothetical protein
VSLNRLDLPKEPTLLSETIELQIRARARKMTTSHAAIVEARRGGLGSGSVASYLASMHFLISHTVPHLQRARARATELGHSELATYFERKLAEEVGHEKWAENDLSELSRRGGDVARAHPFPSVDQLVEYVTELIEADPRLYAVYALCNEYFTLLAGPVWVKTLTESCNIPATALTVVTAHVEADRAHSARALAQIDELIPDPALTPLVTATVERTMELFDQFFQEVVSTAA